MLVLQLNTTHDSAWECTTCGTDYYAKMDQPWETVKGGHLVCATCIKQLFERALEFDYDWPARFGSDELAVSDFESILSPELVSAVTAKAAEMAAIDKTKLLESVKDLARGVDFQTCPGCSTIITLRDGCNHMDCILCLTSFCFLCGEEVKDPNGHGSDHWDYGAGCPRYGSIRSNIVDGCDMNYRAAYLADGGDEHNYYYQATPAERERQRERERMGTAEWEREQEQERTRAAALHIGSWTWNVTMQSLQNDRPRQQQLRLALEQVETDARPLWDDFEALFRQYRPEHFVQEQDWEVLVQEGMPEIRALFDNGPAEDPEADEPLLRMTAQRSLHHWGLLNRPVARVFNMMSRSQRIEAFMWMHNTTRDWDNTLNTPQRSVVFDMGPGGDDTMRRGIQNMLRELVWRETFEHFSFDRMQDNGLLVTAGPLRPVEAQDGSVFVPGEAYWRRALLREIWGLLVHIDKDMVRDPGNILWRDLMQDASDAWLEQRPDGPLGEEFDF
jgi:hypothetical protein